MNRKPFQGVWTVLRFNWHLHFIAILAMIAFGMMSVLSTGYFSFAAITCAILTSLVISLSFFATWLAYDASNLYRLKWLGEIIEFIPNRAVNIHAGFDETTDLLRSTYPETEWKVCDFYDPKKHTEISIKRAREAYPPSFETLVIQTKRIPLPKGTIDLVILFLAAHEIRDHFERVEFFRELRRVMAKTGKIVVTEHLRDIANIAAYSFGAWHFHTRLEWLSTFREAGLRVDQEFSNNLFISTFILSSE